MSTDTKIDLVLKRDSHDYSRNKINFIEFYAIVKKRDVRLILKFLIIIIYARVPTYACVEVLKNSDF